MMIFDDTNYLPENFVLNLKFQFRFESLRTVGTKSANFQKPFRRQSFVELKAKIRHFFFFLSPLQLTFGQVGTDI